MQTGRQYGFDSLRAVAVLFVVMLHALVPYVSSPMPGLLWVVEQQPGSFFLNGLFWGIACCIMPLFFCISGYFSYQLFDRRGEQKFLAHRVRRILLPLACAIVVILPVEVYLWTLGMILHKGYAWKTLKRLNFRGDVREQFWGLSHLWYLQYLFLYGLMFALIMRYRPQRSTVLRMMKRLSISFWLPIILLIPCGLILFIEPEAMVGFQHSVLPVLSKFCFNGLFFAIGLIAAHNRKLLEIWKRYSVLYLGVGLLLLPEMLILIQQYITGSSGLHARILLAIVVSLFSCFITTGCIGLVQKQQRASHTAILYLSESSFFLYLIHHPLIALFHISLARISISADLKVMITFVSVTTLGLAMYHVAVRKTWIGLLLNGRKIKPQINPEIVCNHKQLEEKRAA